MSSNYPEGGMFGSGIYAQEFEREAYCDECDKEVLLVFTTDDWGNNATAVCECDNEIEFRIPTRDPYLDED